ncbi:MAG: hypothetical protein U0931_18690 [Vulcanimicrobiota bacterium]
MISKAGHFHNWTVASPLLDKKSIVPQQQSGQSTEMPGFTHPDQVSFTLGPIQNFKPPTTADETQLKQPSPQTMEEKPVLVTVANDNGKTPFSNPTTLLALHYDPKETTISYLVELSFLKDKYPGVLEKLAQAEAEAKQHDYDPHTAQVLQDKVIDNAPWPSGSTPNVREKISAKSAQLRSANPALNSQNPADYDFEKAQGVADELFSKLDGMFPQDKYPDLKMAARAKAPASLGKKMEKMVSRADDYTLGHLTDTVGARVDCKDLKSLSQITYKLEEQFGDKMVARCDYISNPGENGYRAIHYIVDLGDRMAEIQVTTHKLRAADLATHDTVYKPDIPIPKETSEKIATAADRIMFLECLDVLGLR